MINPRAVVPTSIMPGYPHLAETELAAAGGIAESLTANAALGVPYTDAMIESALPDLRAQVDPNGDSSALRERYGDKVQVRNFDGDASRVTEMDALIAYLQMLGTLVDFTTYEPRSQANLR
jgi:cytochrome c oxidase cbb3-type subunit 2